MSEIDDEVKEQCDIAWTVGFDEAITACGSDSLKIAKIAKLVGLKEEDVADIEDEYKDYLDRFDDKNTRKKLGYREVRKVIVAQTWKNIQDGVEASDALDAAWEYIEEGMKEIDRNF
jgi:hypothetical protein